MKIKIGMGYDIHRLEEGRKLFLGGAEIPFSRGLAGHSDGDCLIHAIIDALLGAMGEMDIGQMFPDTDPQYKGIHSTALLERTMTELRKKGMCVQHVDSVIIAEHPKLASHIPSMKEALCPLLGIEREDLGIKAKTNEGLGAIGRGEAIAALVQVLVAVDIRS